jgi:hypothetical protein
MSKFKVGDRVMVYGYSQGHVDLTNRKMFFSAYCYDAKWCNVSFKDGGDKYTVHEKQLRKLKPKPKPREFWVLIRNGYFTIAYQDYNSALKEKHDGEIIHVREVRKK